MKNMSSHGCVNSQNFTTSYTGLAKTLYSLIEKTTDEVNNSNRFTHLYEKKNDHRCQTW